MADVFLGEEINSHQPHRAIKRKRIRRLIDPDRDVPEEGRKRYRRDDPKPKIHKVKRCSKRVILTCLLTSLSVVILLGNVFTNGGIENGLLANFINTYQEHYHQILNGRQNYCVDGLDSIVLAKKIQLEQTILHQNEALLELQFAFEPSIRSDRRFFIALVGPIGVGKTLYINALQKHFPWQENVHSYVWDTYVPDEKEKYRSLRMIVERFSECGTNLLVIKSLTPMDKQLIDIVAEMMREQSSSRKIRVIAFFVFNLNKMLSAAEYSAQYNSLQDLNCTKTINFKEFGRKELEDCIRHECELENVALSHTTFQELLETIDVKRSGCKNVNAKVLAFGNRVDKLKKH